MRIGEPDKTIRIFVRLKVYTLTSQDAAARVVWCPETSVRPILPPSQSGGS